MYPVSNTSLGTISATSGISHSAGAPASTPSSLAVSTALAEQHIHKELDSNATKNIHAPLKLGVLPELPDGSTLMSMASNQQSDTPKSDGENGAEKVGASIQAQEVALAPPDSATSQPSPIPSTSADNTITNNNFSDLANSLNVYSDQIRFGTREVRIIHEQLSPEALQLSRKYKLTNSEAAAINIYSRDDHYAAINHQLRTLPLDKADLSNAASLMRAGIKNKDLAELIAALTRGLKKLPPAQTDPMYFTCLGRNVTMGEADLDTFVENAEVTLSTFTSTTVSLEEMTHADWWDGKDQALFIYQQVNGNGRDIAAFSRFAHEKEILFLPFTKFKVLFRGEPTETPAGVPRDPESSQDAEVNPKTVKKLLIALQEIGPANEWTEGNAAPKQSKIEKLANYFGFR